MALADVERSFEISDISCVRVAVGIRRAGAKEAAHFRAGDTAVAVSFAVDAIDRAEVCVDSRSAEIGAAAGADS